MSNTEKLRQWFETERRDHGLVDFKMTVANDQETTVERVCGEILDMIGAWKRGETIPYVDPCAGVPLVM